MFLLVFIAFFCKKHRKFISTQRYIKLYVITKDKRFLVKIYFKIGLNVNSSQLNPDRVFSF